MLNRERLLENFLNLLTIEGPSFNEHLVAENVLAQLEALQVRAAMDGTGEAIGGNCGNIVGRLEPTPPGNEWIGLVTHMDTVEADHPVVPRVEGGIIRSEGNTILGADDRAGIAALLEALTVVREQGLPHAGLELIFTVAEEQGLKGVRYLETGELRSPLAFVLDSSGPPGRIVTRAPYHNRLEWTITGKAAHAGVSPESGIDALKAAALGISLMKLGRIDPETTANLGLIQGGKATNIVCERVEIHGETRSLDKAKMKAETEHMLASMQEGAGKVGAKVEERVILQYEGYDLGPHEPVVQMALGAVERAGLKAQVTSTGGGSDASVLNAKGIKSVVLGVGYKNPHSVDEEISLVDLESLARIVLELIRR
ncbi:MAG: M20/M25/M40 family metallo-hydrolase [Bacillota bacterium]